MALEVALERWVLLQRGHSNQCTPQHFYFDLISYCKLTTLAMAEDVAVASCSSDDTLPTESQSSPSPTFKIPASLVAR